MFFIIGLALLVADLLLLNVNAFVFIGVGMILSSMSHTLGLEIPSLDIVISLTGVSIASTIIVTVLFWKKIKEFQNPTKKRDTSSDLIDKVVVVEDEISASNKGAIRYSGIAWSAELDLESCDQKIVFNKGDKVTIVRIEGTTLFVK